MVLCALREPIYHPLDGPYRKVARAKEHFDALRGEIATFTDREPYGWWTEFEDYANDEREYTVFAEVHEEPDIRWGLIAGDMIENLRAALDHLAWQISDPGVRDHNTGFPIYLRKKSFETNAPRLIPGVSDPARTLIERSQPYDWGVRASEHPLAILKALSNMDKHRALLPVSLARRHEYITRRGDVDVGGITSLTTKPIDDGAEVMTFVTWGEPPEEVNVNAYVTFEVAIEGRTLTDFENIFEFIVNSVLDAFDRT